MNPQKMFHISILKNVSCINPQKMFQPETDRPPETDRLFWEVILSDSQEILLKMLTKWLRILRKNVAMVLIKLLPRTFYLKSIKIN